MRDRLVREFGEDNVFMDVADIIGGEAWELKLLQEVARCDVLLAILGPHWMGLLQARNTSGEHDYVRKEITDAVALRKAVIPVRVGAAANLATRPKLENLPADIQFIAGKQNIDVAIEHFEQDIERLIKAIEAQPMLIVSNGKNKQEEGKSKELPKLPPAPQWLRFIGGAVTVAMVLTGIYFGPQLAGFLSSFWNNAPSKEINKETVAKVIIQQFSTDMRNSSNDPVETLVQQADSSATREIIRSTATVYRVDPSVVVIESALTSEITHKEGDYIRGIIRAPFGYTTCTASPLESEGPSHGFMSSGSVWITTVVRVGWKDERNDGLAFFISIPRAIDRDSRVSGTYAVMFMPIPLPQVVLG